jgi:hypothetical protein
VPTPESAEAFAKLVAARIRLTEVTKELNEASVEMPTSNETRQRHAQLQQEWEQAFRDFEAATDELLIAAHEAKGQLPNAKE